MIRRCPRCAAWHAVKDRCPPRAYDLTAWVAGTVAQQRAADREEAAALERFVEESRPPA